MIPESVVSKAKLAVEAQWEVESVAEGEAAVWWARLQDKPSADEMQAFEEWMTSAPTHRLAYGRVLLSKGIRLSESDLARERRALHLHGSISETVPPRVVLPPGGRLASILSVFLTRKSYKRLVEPVIADMQFEYTNALASGRTRNAKWIAVWGHLLAVWNCIYALLTSGVMNLLGKGGGG